MFSSFYGIDLAKSFWGNYYRADGIFTLVHYVLFFLFIVLYFKKEWVTQTIKTVSYSSIILSIWSLATVLIALFFPNSEYVRLFTWDNSMTLSFGNPNFLAGYLIVTLPFLAFLYDKQTKIRRALLYMIAIVIQIIALLLTQSRAGFLCIILFTVGWLMVKKQKYSKTFLLLLFIGIVSSGVIYLNQNINTNDSTIVIAEGRERIFRKAFMAFQKKPALGWGWANFDYAFNSVDWPLKFHNDVYVDKAHSSILEVLTTTGLVGFFFYLLIIIAVIQNYYQSKSKEHKYLLFSYILIVIHMQMNVVSINEEMFFWLLVAIAASSKRFV
jgi:O-antigen ligase